MPHELSAARDTLSAITGWPASNSRQIMFTVVLGDETGKDITSDTLRWGLLNRRYEDISDAVVSDADSDVTLRMSGVVDPTDGEFRVDVAEDTLSDEWGEYWQRVIVDPAGDTKQSWVGKVILGAD